MESLKNGVFDFIKATFLGLFVGCIIGILFILIGLIANKGVILKALYVSRCALLLIGPLCMIFSAGMFLKRGALRPLENKEGWKKHFKILNPGYVMVFFSIGMVFIGSIVDLIIYNIK